MKYFTSKWWFFDTYNNSLDNTKLEAVFDQYDQYVDSIKQHLPPLPKFFTQSCGLHDHVINSLNIGQKSVSLELIEPKDGLSQTLSITGVIECSKVYDPEIYENFEHEDIGYHEVELDHESQALAISMICRTGAEITIICELSELTVNLHTNSL